MERIISQQMRGAITPDASRPAFFLSSAPPITHTFHALRFTRLTLVVTDRGRVEEDEEAGVVGVGGGGWGSDGKRERERKSK